MTSLGIGQSANSILKLRSPDHPARRAARSPVERIFMSWLREADAEPLPGYRLIEPIGSGGFGEVWKCTAPGGILKAIKFVYGNLNADDGDAVHAEQEQQALLRVKDVRHPFVLSMDRIEIVGGELAIVMELADKSLHDHLQEFQARG